MPKAVKVRGLFLFERCSHDRISLEEIALWIAGGAGDRPARVSTPRIPADQTLMVHCRYDPRAVIASIS
jgi:hypothetical protein